MIFRVTTFSFEYFTTKISVQEQFNIDNIESISKSNLNIIAKKHNPIFFNIYKRNLLAKWHSVKYENNEFYFLRLRRIIGKLEINLTDKEEQYLLTLESEDLTRRRAFKTLQYPFQVEERFKNKNCYFFYKDVKFYRHSGKGLKLISNIDLYFLEDQIIFYDKKAKGFVNIIKYNKIRDVSRESYGIQIYAGLKTALLRYDEIDVIYITIIRMIKNFDSKHVVIKHFIK